MGNNPSKAGEASSDHIPSAPGDRKVVRRPSLNAIPSQKAVAADPSATRETAAGHSAAYHSVAQERLQSRSAGDTPTARPVRPGRPERQDARRSEYRRSKDIPSPDTSNPVQVPVSRQSAEHDPMAPSAPPMSSYYNTSTHLQRPPRLPLPIGDANTTPGSPIMGPEDSHIQSMPADRVIDDHMGSKATDISSITIDEDDAGDELSPYTPSGVGKAVPTGIEWSAPGQKVYVTGTFVNWEKKFKLHRSASGSVMSTTLNLRPGTHHLKFIVDGEMRASDTLPTAVDFTNHLVNYVEISADDAHRENAKSSTIPGHRHPSEQDSSKDGLEVASDEPRKKEVEEEVPPGDFGRVIPQFLADLDREEDHPAYIQAANVIGDTPTPPSLPLFLGKSILNSTTPTKDDSSVLNYPNHTVLNHLATSSIKNGVLATSVTTRYKRKYVTTILYKPTGDITGE